MFAFFDANMATAALCENKNYCSLFAQLVEDRAVTREVVSSTPAGPTLRVLK